MVSAIGDGLHETRADQCAASAVPMLPDRSRHWQVCERMFANRPVERLFAEHLCVERAFPEHLFGSNKRSVKVFQVETRIADRFGVSRNGSLSRALP